MLMLLEGWEASSRNVDIYLQVARELPNFEERLREWESDPAVRALTEDRLQTVRILAEVMTGNRRGDLEALLDAAIAAAARRPN